MEEADTGKMNVDGNDNSETIRTDAMKPHYPGKQTDWHAST